MYFYIKPINNNTYYNRESLELIKKLQSLGMNPTGRLSADRQTLQVAEYEKLKKTLGPTVEQKIQNSPVQFGEMLQEVTPANLVETVNKDQIPQNDMVSAVKDKIGATQLAELNKFQFGIAA